MVVVVGWLRSVAEVEGLKKGRGNGSTKTEAQAREVKRGRKSTRPAADDARRIQQVCETRK